MFFVLFYRIVQQGTICKGKRCGGALD